MALIKCPECGNEISDKSDVCIHCGCPINVDKTQVVENIPVKKKNNKMITVAVLLFIIIAAIGASIYCYFSIVIPNHNYEYANKVLKNEEYDEAIKLFSDMNGYKDSSDKILEAYYFKGLSDLKAEKYEEAISDFRNAGTYQDALSQINKIEDILAEKKAKEEKEAAHQAKIALLEKAFGRCLGGTAKLSSDGTELIIDGKDQYDYLSIFDIETAIEVLELPDTLFTDMQLTNSLMGKQTKTYDDIEVSWSYHPDNGLDARFKLND